MPYLITSATPTGITRLAVRHMEEVYERFDVPVATADELGRLADPLTPGDGAPFIKGSWKSTAGTTIIVEWITCGDLLHLHPDRAAVVVVAAFNEAEAAVAVAP